VDWCAPTTRANFAPNCGLQLDGITRKLISFDLRNGGGQSHLDVGRLLDDERLLEVLQYFLAAGVL